MKKAKFKILQTAELNSVKGGNTRPGSQIDINKPGPLPSPCDRAGQSPT